MNTPSQSQAELLQENAELRARLEEAEETLRAIRAGEVDALVMGEEVYTLKGAETPYRLLIESMNEGAATLAPDGTILYCNRRFAEMVATPAEQVIGSCIWQCVVPAQQPIARSLVATAQHAGARAELIFSAPDGPGLPVLLSLRPIHRDSDTIAVVAADLSERKAHEETLRQLNQQLEERVRQRTAELQAIFDTAPIGLAIADDPRASTFAAIRPTNGCSGSAVVKSCPWPPRNQCASARRRGAATCPSSNSRCSAPSAAKPSPGRLWTSCGRMARPSPSQQRRAPPR